MTQNLLAGFGAGATLGAFGVAFGLQAALIVLGCGVAGALLALVGTFAARVDRTRLLALLREVES